MVVFVFFPLLVFSFVFYYPIPFQRGITHAYSLKTRCIFFNVIRSNLNYQKRTYNPPKSGLKNDINLEPQIFGLLGPSPIHFNDKIISDRNCIKICKFYPTNVHACGRPSLSCHAHLVDVISCVVFVFKLYNFSTIIKKHDKVKGEISNDLI